MMSSVKTRTQESLGRYQIEAEIGRGAMGVVYRARDPKIDRLVAIKTISLAGQEPQDEQEYRERFLQEARAAGRLSHPGIVAIYDAGEDSASREPYLVMEYIAGQSLNRLLSSDDRKLPVETALQYVVEIAEALDYAHSQGVIHRDIKPANILITEDGHAKIADFGVARLNHTLTTHTGQIFGSPAYMAPEQLTRGHADARSDLFSVGVMLYSMITGFRPFQGNSAETVCFKVMNVEPVPVTSFQAEVHPALDRIVARAIAKDPDERYQTGAELARDIREFLTSISAEIHTPGPLPLWATQTTGQLGLHTSADYFRQFSWHAAIAVVVIAAALTAWQINRDLRAAAAIPAPSPPHVASAPEIVKSVVLRVIHHRPHIAQNKPQPQAPPAAVDIAHLHLEILHHFTEAKASVLLDDKVVFDETLHFDDQRHPILRALEMEHTAKFDIASGKHQMQVHVVTPDNSYDQTETLEADLVPGSKHVLHVNCDKKRMQVTLQ
jgi:serine/threonine protein kinase